MTLMGVILPWSFELPDEESHGLEGYAVEAAWGRPAGRVRVVLRVDGSTWLVVGGELRVVPLDQILWADHSSTCVRLRLSAEQLATVDRLDRARAVPRERAQAVRVLRLPAGLPPSPPGQPTRGGLELVVPFAALALGLLAALAVFVGADLSWDRWEFSLFALPAALLAVALVTAKRAARG
jgi:hypothetical protein